ncbi:MAG: hypothetical protein MUC50_14775, partial [Myxococcota bacterium]|nr:hypothetical protein [Myxococcota bacterium]
MKAAQFANSIRRNLSIPLACGLFACISFQSLLSRAGQSNDSWQATNQTLTVEEATKRFEQTPEGLFLLDPNSNDPTATLPMSALDYGKPTLVYVHGWQNKRIHMPDVPNRKRWGETHNLLIMRWHKRAFDDSHECPVALSIAIKLLGVSVPLPPKKVYPEGCPKSAEQAIWGGADPTGEFFVRQWKTFFGQHKGYEQEIRVVPVSLGTQPTIYMTYRLYEEEWPGSKPNRLDLLDSYVGMQIVDGTGQMPADSPFPIPPHSGLPPSSSMGDFVGAHSCDEQSAGKHIVCVEENALYWLKTFYGVAIISYWTGVNFRLLPQLGGRIPQFSPVLKLSTDWLCSRDSLNLLDTKSPRCRWLIKDKLNEVGAGWHNGAVWG